MERIADKNDGLWQRLIEFITSVWKRAILNIAKAGQSEYTEIEHFLCSMNYLCLFIILDYLCPKNDNTKLTDFFS